MRRYRVLDLRAGRTEAQREVEAGTPNAAAHQALGEKVVRGGRKCATPVCRVYWEDGLGQTNMVRLYRPVDLTGG